MNIKECIVNELNNSSISKYDISNVPEGFNGDYSISCFKLAKEYKKNPNLIAQEISKTINLTGIISSYEVVGPYINVTLNKEELSKIVFNNIFNTNNYGKSNIGKDKTICVEYSSITLSKQIHIGHLCTTVIGECIAKLYENFGYNVVRLNYLGDMGTPFGKVITMIKRNNISIKEVQKQGIDKIQELYTSFARLEAEDESLIVEARENGLKIEDENSLEHKMCEELKNIALNEAKEIYNMLGISFDDYRGEAYYNNKKDDVVKLLNEKNLLIKSEGALCVDLSKYDMGMYLIVRSDGGSLYSTRDIAAAIGRYNDYKFDKLLYVTGLEQKLHFSSFFKVLELMGYKWSNTLEHIYYGRLSTNLGKISGREGNTPVMKDIYNKAIDKSEKILKERNIDKDTAKDIAVSAVTFSVLKTERIKDSVFNLDEAISFEGNSSVYIEYTDVRLKKIINKVNVNDSYINYINLLNSDEEKDILIKLDLLPSVLENSLNNHEPSYICKYLLELCMIINRFYNNNRVITDNESLTKARIYLCKACVIVIERCMNIVGVKIVDEM